MFILKISPFYAYFLCYYFQIHYLLHFIFFELTLFSLFLIFFPFWNGYLPFLKIIIYFFRVALGLQQHWGRYRHFSYSTYTHYLEFYNASYNCFLWNYFLKKFSFSVGSGLRGFIAFKTRCLYYAFLNYLLLFFS